jgi:Domain of unknown function (DUF4149)
MSSSAPGMSIVELTVLAVWLGASILFAAAVAPALFAVLPSRALAGEVVGRVLPVLLYSGVAVAVFVGGREATRGMRARGLVALVVVLTCGYAVSLGRRIDQVRASIGGPIDGIDAADPRRIEFGRLHGVSVGLLGIAMLAALVLIVMLARHLADPAAE